MAENGKPAEAAVEKVTEQVEKVTVTNEAEKIGNLVVKKIPGMEEVKISSLWQDESVVITFFRRFGCIFCRQAAKELSILKPLLDKHNVKLVGIGMDQVGLDDFVQGNYFSGELYIDPTKETYKALGYKRLSYFGVITSFFSKASREAYSKSKQGQITGNFKGDGLQNGGTIIVKKGGEEVLLTYKAENPADHIVNQDILNSLGITDPIPEVNGESSANGHKEDEKPAENGPASENGTETREDKAEVNGVSEEPAATNEPQAVAS